VSSSASLDCIDLLYHSEWGNFPSSEQPMHKNSEVDLSHCCKLFPRVLELHSLGSYEILVQVNLVGKGEEPLLS
jgi:hypothetical protein